MVNIISTNQIYFISKILVFLFDFQSKKYNFILNSISIT